MCGDVWTPWILGLYNNLQKALVVEAGLEVEVSGCLHCFLLRRTFHAAVNRKARSSLLEQIEARVGQNLVLVCDPLDITQKR